MEHENSIKNDIQKLIDEANGKEKQYNWSINNLVNQNNNIKKNFDNCLDNQKQLIEEKNNIIIKLLDVVSELQFEKKNWNNFSLTRNLSKQISEKNRTITILEKKVKTLRTENDTLKNNNKIINSSNHIHDSANDLSECSFVSIDNPELSELHKLKIENDNLKSKINEMENLSQEKINLFNTEIETHPKTIQNSNFILNDHSNSEINIHSQKNQSIKEIVPNDNDDSSTNYSDNTEQNNEDTKNETTNDSKNKIKLSDFSIYKYQYKDKTKKFLIKKNEPVKFLYKYTKNKEELKNPIGELKKINNKDKLTFYKKKK